MRKIAHKLRDNKTSSLPSRFIFYDTETWGEKVNDYTYHRLRLGVACFVRTDQNYEVWRTFRSTGEFWDFVDSHVHQKERVFIFAHNQHFDFFVIDGFRESRRHGWDLRAWVLDSNRFVVKFKKGSRKLIFLDSGNIVKAKLEKIGEAVGLEKLKIDFDTVSDEELEVYCKRDVEILKRFILNYINFLREHDLGSFKYTIASQSLQAFKHRFMCHKILVHDNRPVIDLERWSYRGGRCEAFFIGRRAGESFYLLDVNSMYPYVMKKYAYPTKLKKHIFGLDVEGLRDLVKRYCVIADVYVETDEPCVGIKLDKLIFPIGSFRAYLTTEELKYLLDRDQVKEVYEVAVYDKAKIFERYVDFFYSLKRRYKEEGNQIYYMITKLFLNSLYGKFGQKVEIFEQIGEFENGVFANEKIWDKEAQEWCHTVILDGKIYEKVGEDEGFDSFVAIASEVTANARMELWRYMREAGLENVYYCDTDSLLVNQDGYERLERYIDDYELGKLSLELETDDIEIRGAKDYRFGKKRKLKGIKENAIRLGENVYQQEQFLKARSVIKLGVTDKAVVKTVTKELKHSYDKGIVLDNGRVIPFPLLQIS